MPTTRANSTRTSHQLSRQTPSRLLVDSISISGAPLLGNALQKREEVSVQLYRVEQFECDILRKFGNAGLESSRFSPGVPWNRIGAAVPGIRSLDPSKCAKARPKTRGPRASRNSA